MVLCRGANVLWTMEAVLQPYAHLLIDLQICNNSQSPLRIKLFPPNEKTLQCRRSSNSQECYPADRPPPPRGDTPFTLQLPVFGTTCLTHPISTSGHQMLLNNFSYRWKFAHLFFPLAPWLVLRFSHFRHVETLAHNFYLFFFILLRYSPLAFHTSAAASRGWKPWW